VERFNIAPNSYLNKSIQAYYRYDYTTYGTEGNPDFINHLKNQFGDTHVRTLQNAVTELKKIVEEDLTKIKNYHSSSYLTVCVIPRAKSESQYSDNQKLFKKVISSLVDRLQGLANGTGYITRKFNTRTTHMNNSGYGGDGEMPYEGITKATCNISNEVRGKDILLIDDIYTRGVNIDEDAIQSLLDYGAKSVIFYAVAKTYKGGNQAVKKHNNNLNLLNPRLQETFLLLNDEDDIEGLARQRGYVVGTIIKHLVEIAGILGKDAIKKFQPHSSTVQKVKQAVQRIGSTDKLKPIFEELDEQISYDEIRLSLIFI
jgi:hypothetical protein